MVAMQEGREYRVRVEFGSLPTTKVYKEGVVAYGAGAGRVGVAPVEDAAAGIARAASRSCAWTSLSRRGARVVRTGAVTAWTGAGSSAGGRGPSRPGARTASGTGAAAPRVAPFSAEGSAG